MQFTFASSGYVYTSPRPQSRGYCSLIARTGIKTFVYSRMGVLRSNREGVHEYTSTSEVTKQVLDQQLLAPSSQVSLRVDPL